jgi:uncharacterized membrane protein YoaK (UPF0700 family)
MTGAVDGRPNGERPTPGVHQSGWSIDSSLRTTLIPSILSVTAGSMDVIGFLGLGGLLTAHVTGNLVILAAGIVSNGVAPLALMLSVPIFIVVLGVTRLLSGGLEAIRIASLLPLLSLQFFLLGAVLFLGVTAGAPMEPEAATTIVAGMLAVAAMAVQNALVQISLKGAPATAVMTSNITRFTIDVGTVLLARDPAEVAGARERAIRTWPAIVGFALGCGLGAACEVAHGLSSLALPAGLSLAALALALFLKDQ